MSTRSSKYRRHAMLALLYLPIAVAGNGLGCRQVAGIEEPATCAAVTDCPAPESPCLEASCVEGSCAYESVAAGSAAPGDELGDCKKSVCDASGKASVEDDPTDSEDGDPCTIDSCEGGVAQHQPATEVPCYTGPTETDGEGNCQPGLAQCVDGEIGECVGQVLPAEETCDEPGDEDCDGMANEAGIGCDCEAGDSQPCYTGDPLTEGIGTCTAGTQMCNPNGMGYGDCTGEVTPADMDNCSTGDADEDCNGLADCQGRTEWYANTVGPLPQEIDAVSYAPDGTVVIAGTVRSTYTFQTQSGSSANGSDDVFVAKLNPATGAVVWFTRLTATCGERVSAMTLTPAGEILLIGNYFFPSTCVINGVSMTSEGATLPRQFLVRLGAGGNIIVTKQLDMHYVYSVAATATDMYIAGRRYNPAVSGDISYYGNKYDLNGEPNSPAWVSGYELKALYAEGNNIWAAGLYSDTVGLPDSFDFTSNGGTDIFVARFTPSFSVGVAASFGGTGNDVPTAIHADASGIYLAGSFASPDITLGGETYTNPDTLKDSFVAKLTSTLAVTSTLHITGVNDQEVISISPSGAGLSIAGQYRGVLTLAGFPGDVPSNGDQDAFVTRVVPDTLTPVWRRTIGGTEYDWPHVAGGPDGETYYVGQHFGPIDIDDTQAGPENPTEPDYEGYVMRMAP